MNSKRGITFSIAAIAAVTVLVVSVPLVSSQQAQVFPFGGGFFFHRHFFFHHF
jgi:hypothetical protein